MTSTKSTFHRLLLAGLVAASAATAFAQPAPTPAAQAPAQAQTQRDRGPHGPADYQAAMARRQAELKQQLQLTAEQEPAWNLFTSSMLPNARPADRPDRDALRDLTTPQRIERMRAHRDARNAEMDRRADATLKLYAALTPAQQKVFDARTARPHGPGADGGPRGPRPAPHKG